MLHRSVRCFSLLLAAAVAVTACSTSEGSGPAAESVPRVTIAAAAPDDSNPFVAAGITVTSIDDPVAGPGLTLTDWQSANLLRDAAAGQGPTGAQLRVDVPMPDDEMPLDLMVGAWVLDGASPVAKIAKGLMPSLDFDDTVDVIFPAAVVVLFTYEATLADAAGNVPSSLPAAPVVVAPFTVDQFQAAASRPQGFGPATQSARTASRPDLTTNPCGALLAFQEEVLGLVYDALGGKDSWLGQKAQVAIGLLPKVATPYSIPGKGTFDMLATLGFIAGLVGSVSPWTVSIVPTHDPIAYGVAPGVGERGAVRAIIDPGLALEWPAALKSCAQLVDIELPEINPVGSIVTWDPTFGPHATEASQEGVIMNINDTYQATFLYDTAVESADQAANGAATSSLLAFDARVDRPGNETFDKLLNKIISRYAGDGVIGAALQYLTSGIAETITDMSNPAPAIGLVTVTFHDPPPPDPVPVGSTPTGDVSTAAGACIDVDLFSQPMVGAAAGVKLHMDPKGSLVWDFGASQPYTTDDGSGVEVTIKLGGSITGDYSLQSDGVYSSSGRHVNLGGTVEVMGNTVALPPEAFSNPDIGFSNETLQCLDGSITVLRTHQVFSPG